MTRSHLTCSARRLTGAFSLIELLVVVTIIVVLLALLTPALDRAIQQTELTVCAAQQNQLVKIFNTWAVENKRKFPAGTRDNDNYEHTPWVSTKFVNIVIAAAGNNKTYRAAPWGIVPRMLIDPAYKDFGYRNDTGWVIGYNYLGGHPMLDKANQTQTNAKAWHSPISLSNQGTGDILSCWNAWSTGIDRNSALSMVDRGPHRNRPAGRGCPGGRLLQLHRSGRRRRHEAARLAGHEHQLC
jgi:type II secretory pathway pseudopilin PulG